MSAVYLTVSEKQKRLRRHAIGIAAVALVAAGIYAAIIVTVANSRQDVNAASDLTSLLTAHGIQATGVQCAHQNGNQYVCQATVNGQPETAAVTDDSHTIYVVGISTSGC